MYTCQVVRQTCCSVRVTASAVHSTQNQQGSCKLRACCSAACILLKLICVMYWHSCDLLIADCMSCLNEVVRSGRCIVLMSWFPLDLIVGCADDRDNLDRDAVPCAGLLCASSPHHSACRGPQRQELPPQGQITLLADTTLHDIHRRLLLANQISLYWSFDNAFDNAMRSLCPV